MFVLLMKSLLLVLISNFTNMNEDNSPDLILEIFQATAIIAPCLFKGFYSAT